MPTSSLKNHAEQLTQRLDHMVTDDKLSLAQNKKAAADLAALSTKLFWHIPDQSLSPFERLERLARAADEATPDMSQLQSAAAKLEQLRSRINQLVPGDFSDEKKIDILLSKLDEKVGASQQSLHTTEKLELLGDPRARIAPEVKAVSRRAKKADK